MNGMIPVSSRRCDLPYHTILTSPLVHKRSDVDYGLENINLRSLGEPAMSHNLRNGARSLELESRNFKDTCQAIAACATGYEDIQLAGVLGVVVEAINAAAIAVGTIWDLLNNKPFLTTVVGGTVATIVGIRGEKLLWPPPAEQCSTAGTDKDTFSSSISQGLSSHPDASSISVDVTGPEFAYTATMTATTGTSPPAPVVGQCFTA